MRPSRPLATVLLALLPFVAAAAADTKPKPTTLPDPCTIHSTLSGSFYDLRPLQLHSSKTTRSKDPLLAANESYSARGWDYPSNFTLNLCAPVLEDLTSPSSPYDVVGVSNRLTPNISAYYTDPKDNTTLYSIGLVNDRPIVRGRKLVLNYTNGSPCPDLDDEGHPISRRAFLDDDEGDEDDDQPRKSRPAPVKSSVSRRKSTFLSFICDTSTTTTSHPRISFLGTPDHCTYIFEVRSRYACSGATPSHEKGTLGPAGVFVLIFGIAAAAYLVGGIVYQRNVMHQRGWRQMPNYAIWSGIWSFFSDMFRILFSSCTRRMPSLGRAFNSRRGGYHRVGTDDIRNGRGGRGSEEDNRLIDDLNEEWED